MQDPAIREAKDTLDQLSADPAVQDLVRRRKLAQELYQLDLREARAETLRTSVSRLCSVLGIELDEQRRQALAGMSDTELDALHETILRDRRWPR